MSLAKTSRVCKYLSLGLDGAKFILHFSANLMNDHLKTAMNQNIKLFQQQNCRISGANAMCLGIFTDFGEQ